MKLTVLIVAILVTILDGIFAQDQTIFQQSEILEKGERVKRQTSADQMVQNILQWLQGVYTQNSRRIRQGTLREYLPPSNTQKPRPFEPGTPAPFPGYPPSGITPQPPFPGPGQTNPPTGVYPPPSNEITPPEPGYPSSPKPQPPFTPPTGYPSTDYPTQRPPTGFPTQPPTGYPTQPPTGYPTQPQPQPGFPTQPPTGYPTQPPTGYPSTGYPTPPPSQRPPSTSYPTQPPPSSFPTAPPTGYPSTGYPTERPGTTQGPHFTSPVITTHPPTPEIPTEHPDSTNEIPGDHEGEDTSGSRPSTLLPPTDEDSKHPPHIHAIDVECAKDMMTISIEFNREFNGVIYSKGFYNNPECRYVNPNSEQTKYKFTVNLNSCGTEFINAFDTQGQSYLENVLVLQNEPGIQEVWDTIRSVRCLWEGNLKESLSVALSVGMLSQEIVTFSGDTAMAKLDIQLGRGPFAQPANGLVKIGEPMTLVVSVSGDPGFDVQVQDCRATSGDLTLALTDDNGCILKPKLFGAFQKTRNTGNTGASIIAYAFFNAFKFPDIMDLNIECNIVLCKTDCPICTEPNQVLEPGRRRRRRDISSIWNETLREDGVTMGKHLRVIVPEDLSDNGIAPLEPNDGVCMSTMSFVLSSAIMISLLTVSTLFSALMWLRNQRIVLKY